MKTRLRRHAGSVTAVAGCAAAAWILTLVRWNQPIQAVLPFAFLGVVLALGMIFGRTVGIFGSIIAALVFAHSLYQPVGSLHIADQQARSDLAWMLLAGVTLSYLLLPAGRGNDESKRSS